MSDVRQVAKRWYPFKVNYKDMFKDGKGTDFVIKSLEINPTIPKSVFNKSNLKK